MKIIYNLIDFADERYHRIEVYISCGDDGDLMFSGRNENFDDVKDKLLDDIKKAIEKLKKASQEVEGFDYQPHRHEKEIELPHQIISDPLNLTFKVADVKEDKKEELASSKTQSTRRKKL